MIYSNHAIILGDKDLLHQRQERPIKCVYIIDGCYIGSTNDLKRRIREYIGRAKRNEPVRSETPIMRYIKERISSGQTIKFMILHKEPCREFIFIKRFEKRGINLLNVVRMWNYQDAQAYGRTGFYHRLKEQQKPYRELA